MNLGNIQNYMKKIIYSDIKYFLINIVIEKIYTKKNISSQNPIVLIN
jgi:hypothetical protein